MSAASGTGAAFIGLLVLGGFFWFIVLALRAELRGARGPPRPSKGLAWAPPLSEALRPAVGSSGAVSRPRRAGLSFVPMAAADAIKARQASPSTGRIGNGPTIEEWHAGRCMPTQRGELVRSRNEVRIANHLLARGLNYEYEPMICGFRPDFYLPESGIVIEYWGMDERGSHHRRTKTWAYLHRGYKLVSLEPGKSVSVEQDLDRQLWHEMRRP